MIVNNQKSLTPKQKKVLDYILFFLQKYGYSPTLQEIASHLQKSVSTAQHYVEELSKKGYLNKEENSARGINPAAKNSTEIPLLGYIAAGEPIEPIENSEPILVPISMVSKSGQYYALEVKGNSMVDDGIWDKDTIVVRHQFTADENDTIVALTEDGATLKKLKFRDGKPYLQPRNPKYPPIYPKEKLEIRGKLVGIIHSEI